MDKCVNYVKQNVTYKCYIPGLKLNYNCYEILFTTHHFFCME